MKPTLLLIALACGTLGTAALAGFLSERAA